LSILFANKVAYQGRIKATAGPGATAPLATPLLRHGSIIHVLHIQK